jgi:hypothetical protein
MSVESQEYSLKDCKKQYDKIQKVFNPFFGEDILFDYSGWNHLLKDGKGNPRAYYESVERFKLLELGCKFLSKNFPPVEYSCREFKNSYLVEYYSFIYAYQYKKEEKEFRLKMVIHEKSNQPKHFYSLIKMEHKRFKNKETP